MKFGMQRSDGNDNISTTSFFLIETSLTKKNLLALIFIRITVIIIIIIIIIFIHGSILIKFSI